MSGKLIIFILFAGLQVQAYDLRQILNFDSRDVSDFPECKSDLDKLINGIQENQIWAYQSKLNYYYFFLWRSGDFSL